uniref:Uncharacterized protein n=1 Tax=viral metagenome TaxID=1070528 RepID=A0A6C0BBC4_9ZZZZ
MIIDIIVQLINFEFLQYENTELVPIINKIINIVLPVITILNFLLFFITKSRANKFYNGNIACILLYTYYYVSQSNRLKILYPLIKSEIPTIFYILIHLCPRETIIHKTTLAIYHFTFIKYKLYGFYYEILYKNYYFERMFILHSSVSCNISLLVLVILFYCLYLLHIWSFITVIKTFYKKFIDTIELIRINTGDDGIININTDLVCRGLCSYLFSINIPIAIYIYSYNIQGKYIFDLIGILTLSVSSYFYHHEIYVRLCNNKIQEYRTPDKTNIKLFINDILAINVRSFLVVTTSYFNSQYCFIILSISGICHLIMLYYCNINIINLLIDYDKKKVTFTWTHNIYTGIAIGLDAIFLYMNSPTNICIPFLLITISSAFVVLIEPLNRLTHVLFHIFLIIQTTYMCLSNIVIE